MTNWKKRRDEREVMCKEFALAALSGITGHLTGPEQIGKETTIQAHARWSWNIAKAMLAAKPNMK